MEFLVNEVYTFLQSLLSAISVNNSDFSAFLLKDIFYESSLIGIDITYNELILYIGTIAIIVFFIVLVIKLVIKLLGVFSFK